MTKQKKNEDYEQKLGELTLDLQRTRADFENYRKRVDAEKQAARESGQTSAVMKLLPVIDNIERAIAHMPEKLADDPWAKGVSGLVKNLDKLLDELNLKRIDAQPGTVFDPERHEAIQFDDEVKGDRELIAEELRSGYSINGVVIRPAMVKVTKQ